MTLKFKAVKMNSLSRLPLELMIWMTALLLLGTAKADPVFEPRHFTFCPLYHLGATWCPGCGLGRSIIQFFHGHIRESLHNHLLGIPATLIISWRILVLGRSEFKKLNTK